MKTALFQMEGVRISYGSRQVIRGIDLAVGEGEFCALLGLNGSGKTTLLHGACGFLPMEGRCAAGGLDCAGLNERRRARLISFIPQLSTLGGGRSVLDVVLMGFNARLGLFQSPGRAHRQAAWEVLERIGYGHMAQRDFGTLSQGQRQLVILARCMVQDTPVMLMDEPDSALDFLNRHMVLGKVRDMIHADGRAGLITLHDPNFAMAYCDRIFLLRDGVLQTELAMASAGREEILEKLSLIYGSIDVIPYSGGWLMGKHAEQTEGGIYGAL